MKGLQFNSLQCNATQRNAMQCSAAPTQCNAAPMQCNAAPMQCSAVLATLATKTATFRRASAMVNALTGKRGICERKETCLGASTNCCASSRRRLSPNALRCPLQVRSVRLVKRIKWLSPRPPSQTVTRSCKSRIGSPWITPQSNVVPVIVSTLTDYF